MSTIEHFSGCRRWHYRVVKSTELTLKQILSVPCPTCGAASEEACELHTGALRTEPHRDRKISAEAVELIAVEGNGTSRCAEHLQRGHNHLIRRADCAKTGDEPHAKRRILERSGKNQSRSSNVLLS